MNYVTYALVGLAGVLLLALAGLFAVLGASISLIRHCGGILCPRPPRISLHEHDLPP